MEKNCINIARQLSNEFLDFVNKGVSPFHVVKESKNLLEKQGYVEISEQDNWSLKKGGKYFFTRNRSTIFAFSVGNKFDPNNTGFKVIGAHTDSPVLRLSPLSKLQQQEFIQTHVATYGGGLWHTWFDRDLTLAGRVIVKNNEKYETSLFHHPQPLLKIPNLAIHLTKLDERGKFEPNKEQHLRPIISHSVYNQLTDSTPQEVEGPQKDRHYNGLLNLISKEINTPVQNIIDMDLYFCDANPSCYFGINQEFISSPRLDNLFSTFMAIKALTDPDSNYDDSSYINLITLFDHEECGSESFQGAGSSILKQSIERIFNVLSHGLEVKPDSLQKTFHNSFCISADMAHCIHPNYQERHKQNYNINMNQGVVLKINFDQRYTTDAASSAILKAIAEKSNVKIQEFMVKNDSPCGSTIGPMTSANTGIKTIDIGIAQLGMHSIRETCGAIDSYHYEKLFCGFFREFEKLQMDLLRF